MTPYTFVDECKYMRDILHHFCNAIGTEISIHKYYFLHHSVEDSIMLHIQHLLPYNVEDLVNSFQHLGYHLKRNHYSKDDSILLLRKMEK